MLRIPLILAVLSLGFCGCNHIIDPRPQRTRDQVDRVADGLDAQTTKTGEYVRVDDPELKERDAWETPLRVTYSQGGVAEMVKVTSAGPDREFGNRDDISAERMAVNFKGVGEGIKQNAGSVARDVAKGAVEGVADGISEKVGAAAASVKEAVKKRIPSLPGKSGPQDAEPDEAKETEVPAP